MIEYNLEAELKKCIKSMHSGYLPKKDAEYIRGVVERCLKWITEPMPTGGKNERSDSNNPALSVNVSALPTKRGYSGWMI